MRLARLTLATTIALTISNSANAASATWNVATDGDWNLATNWNPGVPGATGNTSTTDTAGFGGTTNYKVYLSGSRAIGAQTISNTGTTTLLGGTSAAAANEILYFYSGITINTGSGAVTIGDTAASPTRKVDILTGSYTFANNSTSTFTIANGLQSRGGSGSTTTITLGGSGPTTVSGVVGGGLGAAVALAKTGGGTLTLSGVNTFSGGLTLSGATANSQLNINSTKALGSGTLTISGGDNAKINNTSGSAITIANNNPQTWSNDFTFVGTNDLNMGTGNITLGGNRQITTSTAGKTLTLGGVIADGTNTYSLTKAGAGTLVLTNANTYDGTTTISAGVLRPTNADALGSTTGGTIASAGSLEITAGLSPNSAESLTISGSGDNFIGALRAGAGGGTWAGTIAIGTAGARLGATTGNTLTVTGTIADGAANALAISGQSGTGVVTLNPSTSNTYSGATQIIRGILRLGKTDALPVGTVLDVDQSSSVTDPVAFDLAGFNQTASALQDTATISVNGKINNSVAATTSTLTLNQSTNTTYDGVIENGAGTVALVKEGGGTLTLTGANTFTGATSLNGGRLNVNGAFASNINAATGTILSFGGSSTTSALSLASGATLAGEGTLGGTGSLTFGTGTSTLIFNADTTGSLSVPAVTASGTVVVTPQGTLSTGNTYTVLTNNAGFSGTPGTTYVPSSRGTLAFGGPLAGGLPTELQFTAAAPVTSLTWKGNAANPTFWDVNTTANWDNGTGADVFFDFDSVAFDDSAISTTIAIQPATVSVGAVNVNNPTKDYSISGGGMTGSATLEKTGAASLTLWNANSFSGGVTLNAGKLNINNASALGSSAGAFIIDGGTIDNTSGAAITTVNYPLIINTDIAFTGTNDLNLGAGATNLGFTTAASRTITTNAGTLRLGGAITDGSGGANGITKAGAGTLTLAGASSYTGLTTISAGTLKLGASGTSTTACPLGSNSAGTEVSSGATLDFGGFKAHAEAISIAGTGVGGNGALINSGTDQINALESLTLSANASIGGNGNRFDIRTNGNTPSLVLANFTLTKSGSNYVALVGTNVTPGSGHIDITGGTFGVQTTTTLNGDASNTITVRNGATLDCYLGAATWTAPVWSVLMDAGSNFTNSNGTVAWDGTVTLNGAANFGGGANLAINNVIGGASGSLNKTGAGTLTLTGSTANTYGGSTTVNAGTLALNKTSGNAIPGNVTVTTTGTMLNQADNQISDSAAITVDNTGAVWNLGNKTETIATLNLSGTYTPNKGYTSGVAGKLTVTNLNVAGGGVTLNSSGAGQESYVDANTVTHTGGTWVFGVASGTQSLRVGSGGLTIGGGSTIAVNAAAGTSDNYISLGGNVTSTAAAATNTISGLGTLRLNATRTFTVADDTPTSDLTVSTVIANGSGTAGLTKEGAGTLILNAVNTYTGTTAVNAGTLGGTGSIAGAVTVGSSGTIAPGTSTGTLTVASADFSAGGTLAIEVNDASTPKTDLLATTGALNLTNAKLHLIVTGTPAQTSYTIATAGSITGTFSPANVSGLPSGYALAYTATEVKLVKSGFASWITNPAFGLLAADQDPTDDPDGDGVNNITEFGLDGNPSSASNNGKVAGRIANVGGVPTLVLTLPVRGAATTFTQPGSPGDGTQVSAMVDDVIYRIQNSNALAGWTLNVTEVPAGADKTAIESTMPGLSSGDWTYRTFRSAGSVSSNPKEFLRAAIVTP